MKKKTDSIDLWLIKYDVSNVSCRPSFFSAQTTGWAWVELHQTKDSQSLCFVLRMQLLESNGT